MLQPFTLLIHRWKLFPAYSLILILLAVLPINGPGSQINHIFIVSVRLDYLLHGLVYIPLAVLAVIDRKLMFGKSSLRTFGWFMVLIIFAAVTEWIQYYLPYRAFNINDLMANILGIIIGFTMLFANRIQFVL
jgi:VanZ family protein